MQRPLVAPAVEPVSISEVRAQCRIDADHTGEDTRLAGYIAACRAAAEHIAGIRLITQTWQLGLDDWPARGQIVLPETPVQAIVSVGYITRAGAAQQLDSAAYRLDLRGSRGVVRPAYGTCWPSDSRADHGAIIVTYRVGFGDSGAAVPGSVREWILAHVTAMWENRGAGLSGQFVELPYLRTLLDAAKVYA